MRCLKQYQRAALGVLLHAIDTYVYFDTNLYLAWDETGTGAASG
jgi:hypothetical protein